MAKNDKKRVLDIYQRIYAIQVFFLSFKISRLLLYTKMGLGPHYEIGNSALRLAQHIYAAEKVDSITSIIAKNAKKK